MNRKRQDRCLRCVQAIVAGLLWCLVFPGTAPGAKAVISKIAIRENPLSVEIDMTGRVPVKVIQIDKNELLVALKNADLARGLAVEGRNLPGIREVSIEMLPGDVVALVLIAGNPFGPVTSGFNASGSRFQVTLTPASAGAADVKKPTKKPTVSPKPPGKVTAPRPAPTAAAPPPESAPPAAREAARPRDPQDILEEPPEPRAEADAMPDPTANILPPPVYVPPQRQASAFLGDITDLNRVIGAGPCGAGVLSEAVRMIREQNYSRAREILEPLSKESPTCRTEAAYLLALAYYLGVSTGDYAQLIPAERMFQDAVILHPSLEYLPFAYAAIGRIQMDLKNSSAAEGYFNMALKSSDSYPGMPEVLFYLAEIYREKGLVDPAMNFYLQVFESDVENAYIADAGVGYGRALYEKKQYYNAMSIFNYVVERDPSKIHDTPELLMAMGDAGFELGLSRPARSHYMRVLNLFPDSGNQDMILGRVGDTYGMQNKEAKAVQIYELVREKYPDSEGYIHASIGIARYLKTDQEKIDIYEMIKTRFPENIYARIAMMRLAEIYQKNGEYDKCIQEIEALLLAHPRGLQYEAVKLMQQAYESLFQDQLKKGEFTRILTRYEEEYVRLDKMESRDIALSVGMAYYQAGLHEEAFTHLVSAFKQFKQRERSPELLFALGVVMDETARDNDALQLLQAFADRYPDHPDRVDALVRSGSIHLEQKKFAAAEKSFEKALAAARDPLVRGDILMRHASVYEARGELAPAADFQERAIRELIAAPGKNYDILTQAYKTLGNTCVAFRSYSRAADAFSKALDFSEGERAKANIGFLLGDAYQKGNILTKARDAYEQVVATYDSVWARLARQRLDLLDLARITENS